ncbi:MAG: hypothetical protein ACTSPD_10380 [Promethearchaeota archaeon]
MSDIRQISIIGGGKSLKEALRQGLCNKLQKTFTIGTNYSYRTYVPTVLTCCDVKFYCALDPFIRERKAEFIKELSKLPMIIAPNHGENLQNRLSNTTFVIPTVERYKGQKSLSEGVYSLSLTGLFAITLAILALEHNGTIFILGFDWTRRTEEQKKANIEIDTHFFKDVRHKGVGYTGHYEEHDPIKWFKPFLEEQGIKIYNVVGNPESNIGLFEKISYEEYFHRLKKNDLSQDDMRNHILKIIQAGCPHKKKYEPKVLTSNPPQYPWICEWCGYKGTDSYDEHQKTVWGLK